MARFVALICAFASVSAQGDQPSIDFDTQIMPLLTKAGCNSGACHGAAAGRGEFRLSLYGSRPDRDFEEITRALEGRRINARTPDLSLLVQKPTEMQGHGGGTRIDIDSPEYDLLVRWIHQGALRQGRRSLRDFAFTASETNPHVGVAVQLKAVATFSDGTTENVQRWTVISAVDSSAISFQQDESVTPLRPGRHLILGRYLDRVVPVELIVPVQNPVSNAEHGRTDGIDLFINNRLKQLGLASTPVTDSGSLVRRLSLDLTGRLPDPELVRSFETDSPDSRRGRLIAQLMSEDAFNEFWAHRFAQLFAVSSVKGNKEAAAAYYHWIKESIRNDTAVTDMARRLLMAEGSVIENPTANFYAINIDPRKQAEFVSRTFMGVRLQCANCHDHPLDSWTQDDYHGLAAVFAGVKRGAVIRFTNSGHVIHPVTGEPAVPRIPGGRALKATEDYRSSLAQWLISDGPPFLAKVTVSRIWKHLMGRGLVEPVDDLRVTNPATHPKLFDWLTQRLTEGDYRIKGLIREICVTDAYARSSRSAKIPTGYAEFYPHAFRKPMSPEVFLDAVADVTGVPETFDETALRAVSLAGLTAKSESLDLLGRCTAGEDCSAVTIAGDSLSVQVHLLNGDLLNGRLSSKSGRLAQLLKTGAGNLVSEFYRRAYARSPRPAELKYWLDQFPESTDEEEFRLVAQDFVWSLLNSQEFMTNH